MIHLMITCNKCIKNYCNRSSLIVQLMIEDKVACFGDTVYSSVLRIHWCCCNAPLRRDLTLRKLAWRNVLGHKMSQVYTECDWQWNDVIVDPDLHTAAPAVQLPKCQCFDTSSNTSPVPQVAKLCYKCRRWVQQKFNSLLWPPVSNSWPPAILFYCSRLDLIRFFSPLNLRDRLADRHQNLLHVRSWPRYMKFGQKFGGPFHPKFGGTKTWNFGAISDNFATSSPISPERNKTSSIGKRRCKLRTLPHR